MECMCEQTNKETNFARKLGLYSHPKEFQGMELESVLTPRGKIPSTGGSEEGRTRDAASRRTASPTHYLLSYTGIRSCGENPKVTRKSTNKFFLSYILLFQTTVKRLRMVLILVTKLLQQLL